MNWGTFGRSLFSMRAASTTSVITSIVQIMKGVFIKR